MDVVTYAAGKNYTDKEVKRISELSGAVLSVNGKSGEVEGLAEQKSVDELTTQLADTAQQLDDIAINIKTYDYLKVAVGGGYDWAPVFQHVFNLAQANSIDILVPEDEYTFAQETTISFPLKIEFKKGALIKSIKIGASKLASGLINVASNNVEIIGAHIDVNNIDMRGISANTSHDLILNGVSVVNSGMSGIHITGSDRVKISNIFTNNCMNSVYGDNRAGSVRFNTCKDTSVDNVIIKKSNGKGIAFQLCENFQVNKVFVDETTYQSVGIYINNSHYGIFNQCNVRRADRNALKYSRGCSNIDVINSYFEVKLLVEDDGNAGYVVLFQGATDCTLSKSKIIANNSSIGIRAEDHPDPEGASTRNISIADNVIDMTGNSWRVDNPPVSIEVKYRDVLTGYDVSDVVISGNKIIGGLQALRSTNLANISFTNNVCTNQSSTVVQITATTLKENAIVNNNTIIGANGNGISVYNINGFQIIGNEVSARTDSTTANIGITPTSSSKNGNVMNNKVSNFRQYLFSSSDNTDNINYIGNIGIGISGVTQRGIDFRGRNARMLANLLSDVTTKVYLGTNSSDVYQGEISKQGEAAFSGDGVVVQFIVPHGLSMKPSFYEATPITSVTADCILRHITADSVNLYVYFKTAPPIGTSNVKFVWRASVL